MVGGPIVVLNLLQLRGMKVRSIDLYSRDAEYAIVE